MANISRNFIAGRMNKVVDERLLPEGEYIDAMNIRMGSTENSEIGVIENTKGNIALTKLQYIDGIPLSTNAVCIGAFSDTANDVLYWFVHDPTSESHVAPGKIDMIVSYNIATNILTYHVISVDDGSNLYTTLNFDPSYLITSVNKVGNFLFFTDNYNPPRFINVKRNYPYPSSTNIDYDNNPALLREALLVIKKPPTEAPKVQLIKQGNENNYLNERLICFAYRYKYTDGEYSATSQWSDIAFSPKDFDFSSNSYLNEGMVNNYNAAVVSYNTGGPLVVGIDLLFKQSNNNIIKVIEKLDKELLGIGNNDIRTLTFNSSKIFTILSEGEILRLYDNVPRYAKAQTIMGNRLMYGNYVDGYNLIDKFGTPTRLEYQTELVSEPIGFDTITTSINNTNYNIDESTPSYGKFTVFLFGFELIAGASISIDIQFEGNAYSGNVFPTNYYNSDTVTFSFTLPISYPSVYAMVTSPEFQDAVGTAFNILPVYSPIIGDSTSCDGTTFTDQVNCLIDTTLPSAMGTLTAFQSGINAPNEPCNISISSPTSTAFSIILPAMGYAIDPSNPINYAYVYPKITSVEGVYQKISITRSLHSNRDYEIGIVYMDEFNRSTTALVSPYNTEHVPCSFSINKNSIRVGIPVSQRAPAWAKRYKFVCKPDAENYETIYSSIFFTEAGTNNVYFLLEGENMRKVETGDRYIVKRDTSGALLGCVYATVLEKQAQQEGFITTVTGATPPAGVYMKIVPDNFQAVQAVNSVIDPGQITTNENNGGDYPMQDYPMNIWNGSAWVDYTVPAGSVIQMSFKFQRLGAADGNNSCERRIYTNNVTLVSSANYDNMYDWWIGDNVAAVLDNGTSEVGGSGNCPISNTFYSGFGTPSGDVCNNKYQFYRYGDNQLVLKMTGTQRCNGATGADRRRSSITTKITVFRADALMVFETLPTDALPDVFFENNLSFPIDDNGNHLSNGADGDISQDIALGIPAVINTGFFNCFAFGNAVESYKIRDSIVGRPFNLGQRVTAVSTQDYKEARRYADITYSGVYNQETNLNKLNEFNLGLLNFKNLETSFGDIQVLDGRETDVLVLQEDKVSYVLAGKNLLSDAAAGGAITSVPEVLGTQIARVEKYGISFNPESYVHWGYDRFFTDVKRGAVIQLKGDSMAQDQLAVISELNMRTWFRDMFIDSFSTQKLGGYDPYMNEYVLSINDRQLPSNPQCVPCGVPQTLTIFTAESQEVANYCIDLKSIVGTVEVVCTVLNISAGAEYTLNIEYNGNTYSSGSATGDSIVDFVKDSVSVTTAQVSVIATGSVTLSITSGCPLGLDLTIREVVLTSNSNSGETIHAEYRYTDGGYISPLQSNLVVFQSGTDPVVSRFNSVTGIIGSGSFPTDGSIVTIQANKVVPDTFNFDPLGNKFKYLRSSDDLSNTPVDIATLLSLSSVASPIVSGPSSYHANFNMPASSFGDYLYLIWDLRDSGISNLCYSSTGDENSLKDLCCLCSNCTEACVNLRITNNSPSTDADIYFPSGICGSSTPVTITVLVEEVANICVNNDVYYVTSGDVSIEVQDCGCVACLETCQQYTVWTKVGESATISYTNCNTGNPATATLTQEDVLQVCVPMGQTVSVTSGNATIDLSNACGCCVGTSCITWEATHNGSGINTIEWIDCNGNNQSYDLNYQETIQFCTDGSKTPTVSSKTSLKVVDSCNCLAPTAPCQIVYNVGVLSASSQLVNISPVPNKFPIIYQAVAWGTNGGAIYYGRFFNLSYATNDVLGFTTGVVYHIEVTLSSAFSRDIGLWFGRTALTLSTYAPDATIPTGVTSFVVDLPWNPHNQSGNTSGNGVIGWIGKLGSNLTTGWNGTITVNVFKGSCSTV